MTHTDDPTASELNAEKELAQLRATIAKLLDEQQADLEKLAAAQHAIEVQAEEIERLTRNAWHERM